MEPIKEFDDIIKGGVLQNLEQYLEPRLEHLQIKNNYQFLLAFTIYCDKFYYSTESNQRDLLVKIYETYFNNKWMPTKKILKKFIKIHPPVKFFELCLIYGYRLNQCELEKLSDKVTIPENYILDNSLELNKKVFLKILSFSKRVYNISEKYIDSDIQKRIICEIYNNPFHKDINTMLKIMKNYDRQQIILIVQKYLLSLWLLDHMNIYRYFEKINEYKLLFIECFTTSFNALLSEKTYITIKTDLCNRSIEIKVGLYTNDTLTINNIYN